MIAMSYSLPRVSSLPWCGVVLVVACGGAVLPVGAADDAVAATPMAARATEAGRLDQVVFGDEADERAHRCNDAGSKIAYGLLNQPARVVAGHPETDPRGLTIAMRVDPLRQNYFTLKFSGDEGSGAESVVCIGGRQIGYRKNGDYEAINRGSGKALPGRFYYNTILLPLDATRGRETVELTVLTIGDGTSGNAKNSGGKHGDKQVRIPPVRCYYRAYTHTQPYLDVSDEVQGAKPAYPVADDIPESRKQELLATYRQAQIDDFTKASATLDADHAAKLSIEKYKDDLRHYANVLMQPWSPAATVADKRAALERIFRVIDNHVRDYYGDIRLVMHGGHQGDWGGYYGALGEALYIVEPLLHDPTVLGDQAFSAFLDQPFTVKEAKGDYALPGVDWDGGSLSRREAWERVLKANFDFARARHSYIYNQVLYTYEGAWKAHEGLLIIGSRFSEGKARSHQILREALGVEPYLGEEVLVGPDGRELDLYHSLFRHDKQAIFTADFTNIVAKGLAKSKVGADGHVVRRMPYGPHYIGISDAGLTRENGYVANYGETANYLPEYFFRVLGHAGDEVLADDLLKLSLRNLHARSFTRYPSWDDAGKRVLRMEQELDERNPNYPGKPGYAVQAAVGRILLFAALEQHMADHAAHYQGGDWPTYWGYAAEAVGFAQQQILDHQFFPYFMSGSARSGTFNSRKRDYRVPETYAYVTHDRAAYPCFGRIAAGKVHPLTDFAAYTPDELAKMQVSPVDYGRFAWVDLDNMMIVMRDGDLRLSGVFNYRNRGFSGSGRLHVIDRDHDQNLQIATQARFRYQDYYLRMDDVTHEYMVNHAWPDFGVHQALTGEINPITWQPGVGTVNRENFAVDTPYSSYPDYLQARYGRYLFALNTTRPVYGNVQTFPVMLPPGERMTSVLDLVSGKELPVRDGAVMLPPTSAMVLKLASAVEAPGVPGAVNFVAALPDGDGVGLTWKTAAGAQSYRISRALAEDGPYAVIADGVLGNAWTDHTAQVGNTYFYRVSGVNAAGAGWDSYRAQAVFTAPVSLASGTPWRDDRVGSQNGSATMAGSNITIAGGGGAGLGRGNDYMLHTRDIRDAFHFVDTLATGSIVVQARLDGGQGAMRGLMLRDRLSADNARYVYVGADADGRVVIKDRTRDTRHELSAMMVISPRLTVVNGITAASHPYLKLVRDVTTHTVQVAASPDGITWTTVGNVSIPLPLTVHAGVVANQAAQFSAVAVQPVK
jgi:hypothetical protein